MSTKTSRINWQQRENLERFIACIFACNPKLDFRRIAQLFGSHATYDTIQSQSRKFRALADDILDGVGADGDSAVAKHNKTAGNIPKTPRKAKSQSQNPASEDRVLGGRVLKTKTPVKKERGVVKQEDEDVMFISGSPLATAHRRHAGKEVPKSASIKQEIERIARDISTGGDEDLFEHIDDFTDEA